MPWTFVPDQKKGPGCMQNGLGCLALIIGLPILLLMCAAPDGADKKSSGQTVATKAVTHKAQKSKRKSVDEKLAQALRPVCEEYVRERWEGKYILYDQGRYKWSITNIKKSPGECNVTNCYVVDVVIRFTDNVGRTEDPNFGSLAIVETNGSYQVVDKFAWCVLMDGQKYCK